MRNRQVLGETLKVKNKKATLAWAGRRSLQRLWGGNWEPAGLIPSPAGWQGYSEVGLILQEPRYQG